MTAGAIGPVSVLTVTLSQGVGCFMAKNIQLWLRFKTEQGVKCFAVRSSLFHTRCRLAPAEALGSVPLPSLALKPEHSFSLARHSEQRPRWKNDQRRNLSVAHSFPSEAPHQCCDDLSFRLCPFPNTKLNCNTVHGMNTLPRTQSPSQTVVKRRIFYKTGTSFGSLRETTSTQAFALGGREALTLR